MPSAAPLAAAPGLADWPPLPGLDVPAALQRLSGNVALFRNLLNEFQRTWCDVIPQIRHAIEQQRLDKAMVLAHTLRGVAATLSMGHVATAASSLEDQLKREDLEHVSETVSALDNALQEVLPALSQLPAPAAAPAPLSVDVAALLPRLDELADMLADHNFEATECFEAVQASLGDGPWKEALEALQLDIDNLDFARAQNSLVKLKESLASEAKGTQ